MNIVNKDDQGYATVFGTSIILAVLSVSLLILGFATRGIVQNSLQARADLVALAVAQDEALTGQGCDAAQNYSQLNAVSLDSCQRVEGQGGTGWMILVKLSKNLHTAEAYAGPIVE